LTPLMPGSGDPLEAQLRAQFKRRLLVLLLILLSILLVARFISNRIAPTPQTATPQADATATSAPSATVTALPSALFTPHITFTLLPPPLFLETPTRTPSESPATFTPTLSPSPTGERTVTATPPVDSTPRACRGYGEARGRVWIVAGCDTLTHISQVTGISLEKLLSANPKITDPNIILPNQRINLPYR